jgi:hypothetical protein
MTALCNCHRCDYELRRIASDAGDTKARARMTEPERRRAAEEAPFADTVADVKIAMCLLPEAISGAWSLRYASATNYSCVMVATLLRALVLQELVDRVVAWCEAEMSP